MRIKIGNTWYAATVDQPIMVELTDADKTNIANMFPEATRYAEFHDDTKLTREERRAWIVPEDKLEYEEIPRIPGELVKQILHCYLPHFKKQESGYKHGQYITSIVLGENRHPELIGRWFHEVHVHGFITESVFATTFPKDYEQIMKRTRPETKFYLMPE